MARRMGGVAVLAAVAVVAAAGGGASAATSKRVAVKLRAGASVARVGHGAAHLVPTRIARILSARAALRGRTAPDLSRWYTVPGTTPKVVAARPGVVAASADPVPAPPPGPCRLAPAGGLPVPAGPTPDFSIYQDARDGLGLSSLGPSGTGAGIRLADVEYDWDQAHEDLAGRSLGGPGGLPPFPARDHGTAVLTLLGGRVDGQGVSGLAPGATLVPQAPYFADRPGVYNPARAIATAAAALRAGDVLLIEQQAYAPNGSLGPAESWGPSRDAIAAAVAAGIVVVEPAGNGASDLATLGVTGASGALVVGAGGVASSGDPDLARLPYSNFGARVDVQGFGQAVVTGGYGDLQGRGAPDRAYTRCFDGTSSASATIAAAAADLQSVAVARTGAPLTPAALRTRLVATGTPQVDPASGAIGPRPNLAAAADFDAPAAAVLADGPAAVAPGPYMVSWTSDPADVGPAGRADDEVLVDGEVVSAQAPGAGAVSVTLGEGQHTVGVRTTDRNGNASVTTRSVLVDGTPPAAPELVAQAPGDRVQAGPVTLRWNSAADDAPGGSGRGDDVVSVDGAEVARVPAGVGTVTVMLGEGTHTWSVRSLDLVGNASEATGQVAVGPAPADTAPPATETAPPADTAPPATETAPPATETAPPATEG